MFWLVMESIERQERRWPIAEHGAPTDPAPTVSVLVESGERTASRPMKVRTGVCITEGVQR